MTDDVRAAVAARRLAAGEPTSPEDRRLVGERVLELEAAVAGATRLLAEKESARRFHHRAATEWKARADLLTAEAKTLRHQLALASGYPTKETK